MWPGPAATAQRFLWLTHSVMRMVSSSAVARAEPSSVASAVALHRAAFLSPAGCLPLAHSHVAGLVARSQCGIRGNTTTARHGDASCAPTTTQPAGTSPEDASRAKFTTHNFWFGGATNRLPPREKNAFGEVPARQGSLLHATCLYPCHSVCLRLVSWVLAYCVSTIYTRSREASTLTCRPPSINDTHCKCRTWLILGPSINQHFTWLIHG